jgi:hypothetical protein
VGLTPNGASRLPNQLSQQVGVVVVREPRHLRACDLPVELPLLAARAHQGEGLLGRSTRCFSFHILLRGLGPWPPHRVRPHRPFPSGSSPESHGACFFGDSTGTFRTTSQCVSLPASTYTLDFVIARVSDASLPLDDAVHVLPILPQGAPPVLARVAYDVAAFRRSIRFHNFAQQEVCRRASRCAR